ncbi:ATP-dependent RNA helicase dbp-7 [Apiospora marii]|uniref:ATP-dependent RNA helicase dbp-7 n=2 Tax=Apiospora marii TaxID=335849 RepID=A0ABR1RJM8_9PEZI
MPQDALRQERPAPGQVTSRLFTSNPTAKTIFGDAQSDAKLAQPSNAPLTAEAENFAALGLPKRTTHHLSTNSK